MNSASPEQSRTEASARSSSVGHGDSTEARTTAAAHESWEYTQLRQEPVQYMPGTAVEGLHP